MLRLVRPSPPNLLTGVAIFIFASFILAIRWNWDQTTSAQLDLSTDDDSPPEIERVALDGSWKDTLDVAAFNEKFLTRVDTCRAGGPCAKNNQKLVVLTWHHFGDVLLKTWFGESIWCDSVMDALHALGYSMVIAVDLKSMAPIWNHYHSDIQMILSEGITTTWCFEKSHCIFLDPIPIGGIPPPNSTHLNIPAWKFFNMNWWRHEEGPLGAAFTLSPENYSMWPHGPTDPVNHFLGYSLEKGCSKTSHVPLKDRPPHVWILGKLLRFFYMDTYILNPLHGDPWANQHPEFYRRFVLEHNVTFFGQLDRYEATPEMEWPASVEKSPFFTKAEFNQFVASKRVVLGIGQPYLSPSPYEALCFGVPFINPIFYWDENNPDDRSKWESQADGLLKYGIDEPYVYHVKRGDIKALERALVKAMSTPIDKLLLPHMTVGALLQRVEKLVETDWEPVARKIMQAKGYRPSE